jgi:PAS domain S-box-containing protein
MTSDESFRISAAPPGTMRHTVHFYDRDEELADRVASFIGEGLAAGEAAVIVASEAHRELVLERLRAMNIDLEAQRLAGNLTILDAAGTLAKLMVGDMPDQTLFRRVVGGAMESSATRGSARVNVRAFGEMVDILWRGGNRRGALALEELWTELAGILPFDLLCAYSTEGFQDVLIDDGLNNVCDRHTHVIASAGTYGGNLDAAVPIVQQARALASELAYRGQIEQTLRARIHQLSEAEAKERERGLRTQHLAEELQDTVRVNQLFTGVLAHDLRAPLASIMTAAQLMKIRDTEGPDGRNAKAIRRVLSSGERMSRMIEQLLDFTRLRVAGGIAIEPRAADLAALVRQVVDEFADAYPDCAVQVAEEGDTNGAWDTDRLAQVFSNLVANAYQHGVPEAGVRILVDGSAADVVQVQVHNMGAIPAALIPQVFDPLTGGQRRRDRSRGLGLGLFITERIAVAHAGRVEVSSSETDGTTFTVTLPRFTTVTGAVRAADQQPAPVDATAERQPLSSSKLAALAHEQLRDSEARFRLLVDAVKDYAIFMLDVDGRVVTWNAGAERIKGYTAREIIGRHFSQFYEDEEVRAGKCERELEGAARDGRFEDEGWRVRKDGSRFWANVVITALRNPNGELVGFAKVTRDLTERRRAEMERVELAKAEEAIRLRDEFLSLAAHELKTPLTVLQLQLDTLHNRVDESGLRTAAKLQRASRSSERLANLVESLLDVSRIATGRFELDIKEFDIVESVSNVVDGLRPSAESARCDLTLDAAGTVVGAWDRVRLEQALTNLIANAIKYGAGKPIAVSVRRHGGEVMLQVRDHGPGVPETELERLFRRFERAASIRNYGGLGLGLYFIQAIVDAHGGSVTAHNMPDGGARFQITLPLRKSTAPIEILTQPADVN